MSHIREHRKQQIRSAQIGSAGLNTSDDLCFAVVTLVRGLVTSHKSSVLANHNEALGAIEKAKQLLFEEYILPLERQNKHDNGNLGE
jgi:hypothetical protein